jgi:hypothetical protein
MRADGRHWKTEVVAERVEMLSARGKGAIRQAADMVGPADQTIANGSGEA